MTTNWVITAIQSVGSEPVHQGIALGLCAVIAGLMISVPIIAIRCAGRSGR